jgi:poly(3-hydroxyalkanoate) depolymerase
MSVAAPEISMLEADGVSLRISVRGSGDPILLITGLGASLELGAPFEEQLVAPGRQVISFDAPGIGGSTPYHRPRRMPGVARTVAALIDALGYDRVDVMGVSLGGVVAQQLAHDYPERVRRLVLAATGAGLGGLPGSPHVLISLATPRRYQDAEHYRRIAGRIYGGALRTNPDALLYAGLTRVRPPRMGGYLAQLYAISGWSSMPWLRRLRHRTLVLAGDDDPIVPLVNGKMLAWLIPHARLHVVRGGGHLFMLERPTEIAAVVADFLAEPSAMRYPARRRLGRRRPRAEPVAE